MLILIEPKPKLSTSCLKELWDFRGLFTTLVKRDIRVRYKDTFVGILWAVLQPLIMMVLITFVFRHSASISMSSPLPYPLLVFSGLIFWQLFSGSVSGASESILANQSLVQKIYLPRILLPLSRIGVGVVDFACCLLIIFALMEIYGTLSPWSIPGLLAGLIITLLTSAGLGCLLSALRARYKDMRFIIPFFLQLTLFISPVIYPAQLFGSHAWATYLNPLAGAIEMARQGLLGKPVDLVILSASLASALLIFLAGIAYFKKTEADIADII